MLLLLLNLIQTQRISWLVWAGAGLVFVAAISLIVYFFIRLKKSEKEPEEDWSLSRSSLFVEAPPPTLKDEQPSEIEDPEAIETPMAGEMEPPAPEEAEATPMGQPIAFASEQAETEQPATELLASDPTREEQSPFALEPESVFEEPREEPTPAEPATSLLTSSMPEAASQPVEVVEEDADASPFDEIWDELVQEAAPQAPEAEQALPAIEPVPDFHEPPLTARVEQRAPREPFEPPRIRPINQREPFEPPIVEPLTPREQPSYSRPTQPFQSAGGSPSDDPSEADAPTHFESHMTDSPEPEPATAAPVAASGPRQERKRKSAGAVLGLPTESSGGPLIYGTPAKGADDMGVGSLTHYGKDPDQTKGHGGTITLAIVILLIAGSVLAYLYIPAVNSKMNAFAARLRGESAAPPSAPRAQIYPSYTPQVVDKGTVKARGQVYNIADAPLDGLSIDVSIERFSGDAPETRTVLINPSRLEKGQQGVYEFEYDGKEFRGYRITGMNSAEGQVRFATPPRNN